VLASNEQQHSDSGVVCFTYEQIEALHVTDSAIVEAARFSSCSFINKIAMQDCVMETYKRKFKIRKGDSLMFSAGHAHKDPDVYPEPEKYKYDRFLRDSVSNDPPKFVKDGFKTAAPMFMFSEGKHKCPGRFFAMNEMKMLFLFIFTQLDIELIDKTACLDDTFMGVGISPPVKDLRIRYRLNSTLKPIKKA